ncbi:LamG-like jellyroll fold domain-containing protein [Ekhidna sp. To15]|uniref:LamG-like jellyroll fold domain-containing protein n=1 Tax=Ekhidna sp. To15 TaxID=3395267 RepID=UPI003F528AE3
MRRSTRKNTFPVPDIHSFLFLAFLMTSFVVNGQETVSATYTEGDIGTLFNTSPAASDDSDCPGDLSLDVPDGMAVVSVDVSYTMTGMGDPYNGYKSEQRSLLECITTGQRESSLANGSGDELGTYSYNRTGLSIADGATGTVVFRLHAWRTYSQIDDGCNALMQRVDNNSWKITLNLEEIFPRWYPDADGDLYVSESYVLAETNPNTDVYYAADNLPNGVLFDCNDNDGTVNPGVSEIQGDAIDNDCDPTTKDIPDAPSNDSEDCGQILAFDGTDDYVSATGPDLAGQSFSLEFWAQRTENKYAMVFFMGSAEANKGLFLAFRNDNVAFGFYSDDIDTETTITDSDWHHYGFTYDQSTKLQSIYIDGELDITRTANDDFTGSTDMLIGRLLDNDTRFFKGNLDELKIWNRVLTAQEVSQSAAGAHTVDAATTLLAHYDFNNQFSSTTLIDIAGNHDGVLYNMDTNASWLNADGSTSGFLYYTDADGDNYVGDGVQACSPPDNDYYLEEDLAGQGLSLGDCNDNDGTVNPGSPEIYGDLIDNDCDPTTKDIPNAPSNSSEDCGQILAFDGTDDYVSGTGPNLAGQSFSMEFWAQRTENKYAVVFFMGSSEPNKGLHLLFRNNNVALGFYSDDLDTETTITDSDWHHYGFTYDQSTKLQSIYIDGALDITRTADGDFTGSSNMLIGRLLDDDTRFFKGNLDELKIWNRVLTAQEVSQSAGGTHPADEAIALLAHYDFNNQNGSTTLTDMAGNHDGILNNMDANANWLNADGSTSICVNQPPVLTAIGDKSIDEETELSFIVSAEDEDSETLTFSIDITSSGKGMEIMASEGVFSWTPTSDQVGAHDVTITVSDGEFEDSETITITVNDLDTTNPVITSATETSVAENVTGTVYTATADETVTFSLGDTKDESLFTLAVNEISFTTSPDFENPQDGNNDNIYLIDLIATDEASNQTNLEVAITVIDMDDTAPTITSASTVSIEENISNAIAVYTATTDETVTFSLGDAKDESLFTLDVAKLTFHTSPDFENPQDGDSDNKYLVDLIATDEASNQTTLEVVITVTDVDEIAPNITSTVSVNVEENTSNTSSIYTATADEDVTFSLGDTKDEGLFTMNGNEISFTTTPDFENPNDGNSDNVYLIDLIATDGSSNEATLEVAITVTDVDEMNPLGIEMDPEVTIYPNPVRSYLNLNFAESFTADRIIIFDTHGKEVVVVILSLPNNRIDLSNLNEGIYILNIFRKERLLKSMKFAKVNH